MDLLMGTKVKCDNCDWEDRAAAMPKTWEMMSNLHERVEPGGEVPAGECPKCKALCYVVKDEPPWEKIAEEFGDTVGLIADIEDADDEFAAMSISCGDEGSKYFIDQTYIYYAAGRYKFEQKGAFSGGLAPALELVLANYEKPERKVDK